MREERRWQGGPFALGSLAAAPFLYAFSLMPVYKVWDLFFQSAPPKAVSDFYGPVIWAMTEWDWFFRVQMDFADLLSFP